MTAIFRREWKGYFFTATGYVFMGIFLAAASLVFYINSVLAMSSDLSTFLSMMGYLWLLLCPVLVMRLIAGERKQMTDQLLLTAPISTWRIVFGKYLAACGVLLISSLFSMVYPLLVAVFGGVHWPEVLTMYLGFILLGCAFIAFDLLLSAFFRTPTSALVFTLGANLLLWLSSILAGGAAQPLRSVLSLINLYDRMNPFLYGQLSPANILYFVGFSVVCVFLASKLVEARQWSEAI